MRRATPRDRSAPAAVHRTPAHPLPAGCGTPAAWAARSRITPVMYELTENTSNLIPDTADGRPIRGRDRWKRRERS